MNLPRRLDRAIHPGEDRSDLPEVATNYGPVPYIGEEREEKSNRVKGPIAKGAPRIVVATLARAWPLVGFGGTCGDLPAGGAGDVIGIQLWAIVQRCRVLVATVSVPGGAGEIAIGQSLLVGARCEVTVTVPATITPAAVRNIDASIWGSTFDVVSRRRGS